MQIVSNLPAPRNGGLIYRFGQAGHADPLSTNTAPSQTHTHVTHSTYTSHHTHLKHVTCTKQTPERRIPPIHALTATTPPPYHTPSLPSPSHPHTLTRYTHATQTTVHASQSPQQPHPQHRVLRQHHRPTKDYHRTTSTT